ncbi:MAG: porin family protein [Capnocytophaga sp.]|nr:porin family protein [Capnocytophaga sp.]
MFTTLAVAVATILTANAQDLKFGAKAGLNLSTLSFSDVTTEQGGYSSTEKMNTGFRPGFHIGAFAEYGFNDKWFVETGIAYSLQGAKLKSYEGTQSYAGVTRESKTNYESSYLSTQQLNIPIWVKYDISRFRPKVGVNLGFLTNVKAKIGVEGESREFSLKSKNGFDFGAGVGVEYNLPMGLFFDATFQLGFTKLSLKEDAAAGVDSSLEFKNRVFQIGVGYKF